jgi:hypothetical protein
MASTVGDALRHCSASTPAERTLSCPHPKPLIRETL